MKREIKDKGKIKYYVDRHSVWAQSCIILMLLSAIFRLIGCWGLWDDSYFFATQLVLPICCNLLFIVCVFLFGKKGFWISVIPLLLGVVFFTVKALGFDNWMHTILCILLYLVIAVVYTGTVFGVIGTKWLLPPLFAAPLVYHIFFLDIAAMQDPANAVTLSVGMQEMSVLCIMAAMLSISLALKKRKPEPEESNVPKAEEPVVVPSVENTVPTPVVEAQPPIAEVQPYVEEFQQPVIETPVPTEEEQAPAMDMAVPQDETDLTDDNNTSGDTK